MNCRLHNFYGEMLSSFQATHIQGQPRDWESGGSTPPPPSIILPEGGLSNEELQGGAGNLQEVTPITVRLCHH